MQKQAGKRVMLRRGAMPCGEKIFSRDVAEIPRIKKSAFAAANLPSKLRGMAT